MKRLKKTISIIVIIIICSTATFFIGRQIGLNTDTSSTKTTVEEQTVGTQTIKKTLSGTGEISTTKTENLSLSTTKYFKTMCVEEDDIVEKGENILEYTDGTYLTAPYDCVITKINIPSESDKCTNEHYITISATNLLAVNLSVDETIINKLSIGKEAKITISSLEDTEITGYITKISNTASNGKFTIVVEFENNGQIKIGMTANVVI